VCVCVWHAPMDTCTLEAVSAESELAVVCFAAFRNCS
jgi:hypothetical protein